jgi:ATP-dependent helicase/nuclease subunit A
MSEAYSILVDPGVSLWVSAHAGAGKTRVLIDRVARLLIADTPPDRILCLTFTKAAAAEMAVRLAEALGALAFAAEDALIAKLAELGVDAPGPDLLRHARTLFARALETPGGLKIQTIHGFCERLLGRFPIEAGIAPGFAVLDERSAAALLEEAQRRTLGDIAHRAHPADLAQLEQLARLGQGSGLPEILRGLLTLRRDRAGVAGAGLDTSSAAQDLAAALGLDAEESEAQVEAAFLTALPLDFLRYAAPLLALSGANDQVCAEKLGAMAETPGTDLLKRYCSAFVTQEGKPKKELCAKALRTRDPALDRNLRAEQARVLAYLARLKAVRAGAIAKAALSIGLRVIERYDSLKAEGAALDYDDLVLRTAQLFTRSSATWVLYKLDGGIDHILVDEAQDTNALQWRIITALADEFFAGEGARPRTRTVFAVGDEKQSIYRFQGSDPAIFERMQNYFEDKLEAAGAKLHTPLMNLTRRSAKPVLGFVDAVFADPELAARLSSVGTPPAHAAYRTAQAGLVELWPTEKPVAAEEPLPWDVPLDYLHPESPRARLARKIATVIAGWLEKGERLISQDRPITPGDIMILVRRRDAFVDEVIRALKRRQIPVAGSDRLSLTEHLAVMDLMALGQFAIMPADDLALACVLKSPVFALSEEALFTLAHGRAGTLYAALNASADPKLRAIADSLCAFITLAHRATPFGFYTESLGARGLRSALVARLGADAQDPIDEFLRLALDYERLHPPSLQGFLHWLSEGQAEVKRDMDQGRDEVRVMTVHGAKGLESNILFLPDCCSMPHLTQRPGFFELAVTGAARTVPFWSARASDDPEPAAAARMAERIAAEGEHLRLLYVALTRARDRLYICGHETKQGLDAASWHALCARAMEKIGVRTMTAGGEEGFRIESAQTGLPDKRPSPQAGAAAAGARPAWFDHAPKSEPAPGHLLSPSRLGDEGPAILSPLAGLDSARFQRGRLIHRLLQFLPDRAPDARAKAAARFLAQSRHGLSPGAQHEIAEAALRVLADPGFALLFGPASRAEVPLAGHIALGGATRPIFGVVDRLAIAPGDIAIIDYKTDRHPPDDPAAVPPGYRRQLAVYRALLARLYPGRAIHCALLWTETPALMTLPPAALDAVLAELAEAPRSS